MHKDLYNNAKTVFAVDATTLAGDGNTVGVIIDTDGFESGKLTIIATAVTTGDVTFGTIEESSDSAMSGATAIPVERIIGAPAVVDTVNTLSEIGFVSTERYVRLNVTGANSAALTFVATCELADPSSASVRG